MNSEIFLFIFYFHMENYDLLNDSKVEIKDLIFVKGFITFFLIYFILQDISIFLYNIFLYPNLTLLSSIFWLDNCVTKVPEKHILKFDISKSISKFCTNCRILLFTKISYFLVYLTIWYPYFKAIWCLSVCLFVP